MMRITCALLSVLSTGTLLLSSAYAVGQQPSTEPKSPSAAPAAAAPSDSTASSDAKPPAAAAATTATPDGQKAAEVAKSTELSPDILKRANALGYRVEHKGSEVFFCRKEVVLGSRFEKKVCNTPEQVDQIARTNQEMVSKMQRETGSSRPGN